MHQTIIRATFLADALRGRKSLVKISVMIAAKRWKIF